MEFTQEEQVIPETEKVRGVSDERIVSAAI
jgi:hypothetical protein